MTSTRFRAEIVEVDSPRWSAALAGLRHDIYHTPSYVAFAARRQEVGVPLAFLADEDDQRFFLPLIIRQVPADLTNGASLFDATGPRGYPGPLVRDEGGPGGAAFIARAITAFRDRLRDRSVVSAYARLHPLLLAPYKALQVAGEVVEQGETVSIDLTLSSEENADQTRTNHRRDIARATAHGYVARIDESWQRYEEFLDVYDQSMIRLGADSLWRLGPEYFADLRASQGGHVHLCVVEIGDELAAATILTEVDGIVEYHIAGTSTAHLSASPSKVLIAFVRRWAKERGNRVFHLAGSPRVGDQLNHFKVGFSPLRHPVGSWRVVVDPEAYAVLEEGREARGAGGALGSGAFFPTYRRP